MAYVKKEKVKQRGTISLYFNYKIVAKLTFKGAAERTQIIERWKKYYQIPKIKGIVFVQIIYYEKSNSINS